MRPIASTLSSPLDEARNALRAHYYADEHADIRRLADLAALTDSDREAVSGFGADLVRRVRKSSDPRLMEAFLAEYGLSTREGVALMCLAEALLRVPDAETVDELIRDKIAPHDWSAHSGGSGSIFVNASTWALMLTGRVLDEGDSGIERTLRTMVRRLGEPVIRTAVAAAMREMGEQFVLGRTIREALKNGREPIAKGYLYSFDMLGEAARTEGDAQRYHRAYAEAIDALASGTASPDIRRNHGISVKLSALHPRYEATQRETMLPVLCARLLSLALAAAKARMGLNIDAEEADRLDLSLDVIETVLSHPELAGWEGFGVVVQAYGPRALFAIDWLHRLAERLDRRIMVRLVKGAYWDTEIKRAQALGLPGYPVFTRKENTDVSYIACARKLLSMRDRIYPQFATHNAHTVAAILAMAGNERDGFEFQRLHGMGEALHEAVRRDQGTRCRIYAPVGAHSDLLAYLVRRLLENGANSSFVHQIVDEDVDPETIARDPFDRALANASAANPAIPKPSGIFLPQRANSRGYDIADPVTSATLETARAPFDAPHRWSFAGAGTDGRDVANPADAHDIVGDVAEADEAAVGEAVGMALASLPSWATRPARQRASILRRAAELYETNTGEFLALCCREAGKTLADAIAEIREAVDFLSYYAGEAERLDRDLAPRGVIGCISPWNFPLAIFTGQVAAALVTGNAVVAKPAEQTPLIAARAVALLHEAGVPADVLRLVVGDGPGAGAALVADPRIAGICFTGSTDVAKAIERQLARSAEPDAMLIAETGGLNAMIVDSTALPEQAVRDIVASAFQSAGQRCSALRILYVQKDVERKVIEMLTGAMEALIVGDPRAIATDVGPVIDDEAADAIRDYCADMIARGRLIAKGNAPEGGRFVAPHILRVGGIEDMQREIFGPVLHVATFEADRLEAVVTAINAKGYGLTFGLHTRIDARVQTIVDTVRAGNVYVNRNQIGAVVGSQPFGGEGLSGTGPKAGGPHYLRRFMKSAGEPETNRDAASPVSIDRLPQAPMPDKRWSVEADRIAGLRRHLRGRAADPIGAAAALDYGAVDLPGPTGEANALSLYPRGTILCLGPSPEALLAQVVQALAAGNAVIAVADDASSTLKPLAGKGLPLTIADGVLAPHALTDGEVDLVAFAGSSDRMREIRQSLAARSGPIVPLIAEMIHPAAYAVERAVCVDTTAAGGNASLLAAT